MVDKILNGRNILSPDITPDIEDVTSLYRSIYESPSTDDMETYIQKTALNTHYLITPQEIEMAQLGWTHSAPGLDGITTQKVKSIDISHLSIFYSCIFGRNIHPPSWKLTRTVLVPKDNSNPKNPNNWRPITIGSAIQRLMHRIITNVLKSLPPSTGTKETLQTPTTPSLTLQSRTTISPTVPRESR